MGSVGHENMMHIWTEFLALTGRLDTGSVLPQQMLYYLKDTYCQDYPIHIVIERGLLHIEGVQIDLRQSGRMLLLFKIMIEHKEMARDVLITNIYGSYAMLSERQRSCYRQNILKLLSRARNLLEEQLPCFGGFKVDWLPFDSYHKTWSLYKVRNK